MAGGVADGAEEAEVGEEVCDFVEGVGVAAEGEGGAFFCAEGEEVGVGLVVVEVDFGGDAAVGELFGDAAVLFSGGREAGLVEEAPGVGEGVDVVGEELVEEGEEGGGFPRGGFCGKGGGEPVDGAEEGVPVAAVFFEKGESAVGVAFDFEADAEEVGAEGGHGAAKLGDAVAAGATGVAEGLGVFDVFCLPEVFGGKVELAGVFDAVDAGELQEAGAFLDGLGVDVNGAVAEVGVDVAVGEGG